MRIVLDVNILASAAPKSTSVPGLVLAVATSEGHELAISEKMIVKLSEVLQRPYFASRMVEARRHEFVQLIKVIARPYVPDPTVTGIAADEEDDRILGTAVAAHADFVVTGDKGLLRLRTFKGIPIVSARQFLVIVEG